MKSSLPKLPLLLLLLSSILISSSSATKGPLAKITYHHGPLLTGKINLSVLWYGNFSLLHKTSIGTFIESLNNDFNVSFVPRVSHWWDKVESYQVVANKKLRKSPNIDVKVVGQVDDPKYSAGKALSSGCLEGLVKKATAGTPPNSVAVIFAARDVKVEEACSGSCYLHGVLGKQVYIVVGNPIEKCSKKCTWPFTAVNLRGPPGFAVLPPNKGEGSDAMIVHFATALAATVTNPYRTGFYGGAVEKPVEVGSACMGMFGSGSFPGYTGRIRLCPNSGMGFNAHGLKSSKFLLPAVWDPKKSSCWTTV